MNTAGIGPLQSGMHMTLEIPKSSFKNRRSGETDSPPHSDSEHFQISTSITKIMVETIFKPPSIVESMNNRATWKQQIFSDQNTSLQRISPRSLKPKGIIKRFLNFFMNFLISTPVSYHRRSKSIADQLLAGSLEINENEPIKIGVFLQKALREAKKLLQPYELVHELIDLFSVQLDKINYGSEFVERKKVELGIDHARKEEASFIEKESEILKKQMIKEKAAEIVFHLLSNEMFKDFDKIAWMQACAKRMGRFKDPVKSTRPLALLIQNIMVEKQLNICAGDPYEIVGRFTRILTDALNDKGYGTHISNREEVADALHVIWTQQLAELRNSRTLDDTLETLDNPKSTDRYSRTWQENQKRLEVLLFANFSQCSRHFIGAQKWTEQIELFFRIQPFDVILQILKPVQALEGVEDLILKTNNWERISRIEIEFFQYQLCLTGKISLSLLQSVFEHKIVERYRMEAQLRNGESKAHFIKLFDAKEGPWKEFLYFYNAFSKKQEELPPYLKLDEVQELINSKVVKDSPPPREAATPKELTIHETAIETIFSNSPSPFPKSPNSQIISGQKKFVTDENLESLLTSMESEFNARRLFFSTTSRGFFEFRIKNREFHDLFFNSEGLPHPISELNSEEHQKWVYKRYKTILITTLKEVLSQKKVMNHLAGNQQEIIEEWSRLALKPDREDFYDALIKSYDSIGGGRERGKSIIKRLINYTKCNFKDLSNLKSNLQLDFYNLLFPNSDEEKEMTEELPNTPKSIQSTPSQVEERIFLEKEIDLLTRLADVDTSEPIKNGKAIQTLFSELIEYSIEMPLNEIHFSVTPTEPESPLEEESILFV
jgi:hypothetical protein